MDLNLSNKHFCVFGLKGAGKSYFLKHGVLPNIKKHIVVDFLKEYGRFNAYEPSHRSEGDALNFEINNLIAYAEKSKQQLLLFDEANRVFPSRKTLTGKKLDLLDFSRHWNMAVGFAARRPTQLHTDVVELAQIVIIFCLDGKNDFDYLNRLYYGLGDTVRDKLSFEKHNFLVYRKGEGVKLCEPI